MDGNTLPPEARWAVRASARCIAALNAPAARRLTLLLAMMALLFRRVVPGSLLQRGVLWFVRREAACCRAGSPHYKFMERYVARFERTGTFDRARRFLRTRPRLQAARHLDAWVRVGLLGTLRNEILTRHLGTPGVPPRLLNEVQLALSPGCDLACEGCYTAEDRGGAAPRRERIASLVDEAASCGAFVVHVIGKGEPFLSPAWARELLDVIESRPQVFFTVATHGMHIDDALAERMARIGNLVLLVAVDGPEPLHDARRGAGSYRRVHEVLGRLRARGILFGWSCMVSAKSHRHVTSRAFVRAEAEAGAIFGIYSRYFPLASTSVAELALEPAELAIYTGAFEAARVAAEVPLLDLDEVEQHTGCHSRAGESVYIDGITGQVAPCVRVPFAPPECRVDPAAGRRLAGALAHAFFEQYRRRTGGCPSWCGANLGGELAAVGHLLEPHAPSPPRLVAYHGRSGPVRRLPVLSPESES